MWEHTAQHARAGGQCLWLAGASSRAYWKVAWQEGGVFLQPPYEGDKGRGYMRRRLSFASLPLPLRLQDLLLKPNTEKVHDLNLDLTVAQ